MFVTRLLLLAIDVHSLTKSEAKFRRVCVRVFLVQMLVGQMKLSDKCSS